MEKSISNCLLWQINDKILDFFQHIDTTLVSAAEKFCAKERVGTLTGKN